MVLDTIGKGIDAGRVWPQNALLTVDRVVEDADRDAGVLRLPPLLAVRRPRRQARRDQRQRVDALGLQEPRRQHRRGHVQLRHGGQDDDVRDRRREPAVLRPRQRLRDDQEVAAGSRAPRPEQRRGPTRLISARASPACRCGVCSATKATDSAAPARVRERAAAADRDGYGGLSRHRGLVVVRLASTSRHHADLDRLWRQVRLLDRRPHLDARAGARRDLHRRGRRDRDPQHDRHRASCVIFSGRGA